MKNFKIGILLLIAIILASCNTPEIELTNTPGPTQTSQPAATATQTLSPPATEIPPTKTPKPTPTPNPFYTENCVEVVEDLPEVGFPGVLVLSEGLLDLSTFQLTQFDNYIFSGETVSPDGNLLAAKMGNNKNIVLLDNTGTIIKQFNLPSLVPIYWLDNTHLVLRGEVTNYPYYDYQPSTILDIETSSLTLIENITEQITVFTDGLGRLWGPSEITRTSISPNQSFLVFPQQGNSSVDMVLWNIKTYEEIISFPMPAPASFPRWNSTGEKFLISAPPEYETDPSKYYTDSSNELFAVHLDGSLERLSWISPLKIRLNEDFVWSPDDSKIVFRLFYEPNEDHPAPLNNEWPYAVLNLSANLTENLCIGGYSRPFWSPDGRYIAFLSDSEEENLILIDLLEQKAYSIYQSYFYNLIGWMN